MRDLNFRTLFSLCLFLLTGILVYGQSLENPFRSVYKFGYSNGWTNDYQKCIVDMDNDGKLDIIGFDGGDVIIAKGNGDGTFEKAVGQKIPEFGFKKGWGSHEKFRSGNGGKFVTVANMNADSYPDIVGISEKDGKLFLSVSISNAGRSFGPTIYERPLTSISRRNNGHFIVTNITGDSRAEIIYLSGTELIILKMTDAQTDFKYERMNKQPSLNYRKEFPVELGDVDGDGKSDLIIFENQKIRIYLGKGDGTFGGERVISNIGIDPKDNPIVADVSGDGKLDLVVFTHNDIKVAYNTSTTDKLSFEKDLKILLTNPIDPRTNKALRIDGIAKGNVNNDEGGLDDIVIYSGITYVALAEKGKEKREYTGTPLKLQNTNASLHSFDIIKVDPLYIDIPSTQKVTGTDKNGGMKKQIFNDITKGDVSNWKDIGVDKAYPGFLTHSAPKTQETKEIMKTHSSQREYSKSLSAKVGGGIPGFGSASASVKTTFEGSKSSSSVYRYTSIDNENYVLEATEIDYTSFTTDFKNAVENLSAKYGTNNFEGAMTNFIKDWGTHYPESVTYGGRLMSTYNMSEKAVMESFKLGIETSVDTPLGNGGVEGSTSEKMSKNFSSSQKVTVQRGQIIGIGGDPVPVKIKLTLITNLFSKIGGIKNVAAVKKALDSKINKRTNDSVNSLENAEGYNIFTLYDLKFKLNDDKDPGDEAEIYGDIVAIVQHKNNLLRDQTKTWFWSYAAKNKKEIKKGATAESFEGQSIKYKLPENAPLADYSFYVNCALIEDDNTQTENISGTVSYRFDYIKTNPKPFTLDVNDKGGHVTVTAKVQRIHISK